MAKQKQNSRYASLLNIFGTVGYLSVLAQWFMMLIIFTPSIITSPVFQAFLPSSGTPSPPPEPVTPTPIAEDSAIWPILGWIFFMLSLTAIVFLVYWAITKGTRSVAKTGQTITHKPAELIVPVASKKFHLKKRQKIQLANSIIFSLKLFAAIIPFVVMFFSDRVLSSEAAVAFVFISSVLFAWSLLFFVLQYTLSRLLKVSYEAMR